MTWANGLFWLGAGNVTGLNLYISFYDPKMLNINELSIGAFSASRYKIPAHYFVPGNYVFVIHYIACHNVMRKFYY